MGAVIFSDVHADADAIGALASCIGSPFFRQEFGPVDILINLGDLLHRGNRPRKPWKRSTLSPMSTGSFQYLVTTTMPFSTAS